jgi:hypothetical protein
MKAGAALEGMSRARRDKSIFALRKLDNRRFLKDVLMSATG